jgi:hypothetical protein
MNNQSILFNSIIIFALTLNVGFVYGDPDVLSLHHHYDYYAVVVMNILAMIMKFGDESAQGQMLLSTSIVAVIQLLIGTFVWSVAGESFNLTELEIIHIVIGMSIGALVANLISVTVVISKTLKSNY